MPIYLDQLQAVIGQKAGQRQGGFVPLPQQALQQQQQPQQQNFLQRFNVLPTVGAISGAIGGSFLAPGAGTIGGGAAGAGLGELLEQILFNKGKFNVGGLAAETALGGLGGVAGRLLGAGRTAATAGRVAGEEGEKLIKRGLAKTVAAGARRAILKPEATGPFFTEQQAKITGTLAKQGLRGSPRAIGEQIPNKIRALSSQAKQLIKDTGVRIDEPTLKAKLLSGASKAPEFNQFNKSQVKLLNSEIDDLIAKTGGKIENINDFKLGLGNDLKPAFRIRSGELARAMSDRESAKIALWDQLDDIITGVAPDAKDITTTISTLIQGSGGIEKAAETGVRIPVPFAGRVRLPDVIGRPIQAAVERGAGAIEGAGVEAAIPSALGRATRATAGQLIPRALTGFGGTQAETGIPQEAQLGAFGAEATPQPLGTELTQQQPLITREQAFQLLLSGAEPSLVNALLKVGGPQALPKPSPGAQEALLGLTTGAAILQQLKTLKSQVPSGGLGAYGAALGNIIPGVQLPPQAATSAGLRKSLGTQLARSIAGEKGVVTDADVARIHAGIPSIFDTPEVSAQKFAALESFMQNKLQGLQAFPTTGIDTEAILQSLTGGF